MARTDPAAGEEWTAGADVLPKQGVSWQSFYQWRKRLAKNQPVRFALVETQRANDQRGTGVELWLSSGDRLRIAAGVDAATLRTLLAVLREPR